MQPTKRCGGCQQDLATEAFRWSGRQRMHLCLPCEREDSRLRAARKRAAIKAAERSGVAPSDAAPADFTPVACATCGTAWMKRKQALATWSGCCRSCAYKARFLDPEYLERHRANARALVARLGGILNRRLFTTERVSGPNSNKWKGGITPAHRSIRASDAYEAWRRAVFVRDAYTCVWCGKTGGDIHADHIELFATHPELRLEVSNGRTLCVPCHKVRHATRPQSPAPR